MTRQIRPEMVQNIYMTIFTAEEKEFLVSSDRADYYTVGIRTLTPKHEDDIGRLNALLSKLDDSRCISLFVMPAEPWSVPATVFWQYDAGFDQYLDMMVNEFEIRHIIYGNGPKYSFSPTDDSDVAVFLERNTE